MKLAIYGNNLNVGYFFARSFRQLGVDAKLLYVEERLPQDRPGWWIKDEELDRACLIDVGKPFDIARLRSLASDPRIAELYALASTFDVILFMQDGPAIFSELPHPAKVFMSQGGDLQNMPFALDQYLNFKTMLSVLRGQQKFGGRQASGERAPVSTFSKLRNALALFKKHMLRQLRQRRGLRQCARWICQPNQIELIERLSYPLDNVSFLPLPHFLDPAQDADPELECRYGGYDIVFLHPTRQLFLPLDRNPYMKGNDKLLRGYADFISTAKLKTRLILVRKGRAGDLAAADDLIREVGLTEHIEWLEDMPNTQLRRFYLLENCVVCDQYESALGYLGAIGREASIHGCPLVTTFEPHNRLLYGDDLPPHVFPAKSVEEIREAMVQIAALTPAERSALRREGKDWALRNHAPSVLVPKYLDVLQSVLSASSSQSERPSPVQTEIR